MWRRFLHACQVLCISPQLPCHICHMEYIAGTDDPQVTRALSYRALHRIPNYANVFWFVIVPFFFRWQRKQIPPLTSYLLLFSYSIKHIQIYTICRKTDDCTLHIIKKRKQKEQKNQFVNCRHSPPSIVSEIQIQQKLYLKITRLPNTQQIFSYYTCAIPIVFFFFHFFFQFPY